MSIRWLSERAIRLVHLELLALEGGLAGVRDEGLIQSALARPVDQYEYAKIQDVPTLAAYYAIAISKNHPFVDGNKRTAFAALNMFLHLNGYKLRSTPKDALEAMLKLANDGNEEEFCLWVQSDSSVSPTDR